LQFGEINIDSELVARQEILEDSKETILTLSNGDPPARLNARKLVCPSKPAGWAAGSEHV
jgi:hypothetical protein